MPGPNQSGPGPQTGGGSGLVRQTLPTRLTNAQVRLLPTVPVVVIPPQGVNILTIPTYCSLVIDVSGGAYGAIDPDTFMFLQSDYVNLSGRTLQMAAILANASLQFTSMVTNLAWVTPSVSSNIGGEGFSPLDAANLAVELAAVNGAGVNYSDGNAANSILVSISYQLLNVSTGLYV